MLDSLPSRPDDYSAILEAIANSEIEMCWIVGIFESDLAMSAKLLQRLNSACFGVPTQSMWTGNLAAKVFDDERIANHAFTAGMLYDIGLLVMATKLPERAPRQ